jgi:stage V sporulation protein D (sporulation-specific penicillin-binding protein)
MRRVLAQVVNTSDGSGRKAYIPGYRVGGKTGTSEKLANGGVGYVVSFAGIAPMDDPQVAVLVALEDPVVGNIFGSVIAAPVVGAILTDILPYLGVEPVYTESEAADVEVKVPYVVGSQMHDAISAVTIAQLGYKTVGTGTTVSRQVPAPAEKCPKGTTVVLYMGGETESLSARVPDVRGLELQQATRTVLNAGLNINAVGDKSAAGAVAVSQEPEAGATAEAGDVVTVTFAAAN